MRFKQFLKENESQFLTNHDEIKAWLYKMDAINGAYDCVIHPNGVVDVDTGFNINNRSLTHFLVQFGVINGSFRCSYNYLKSLTGCPSEVNGNFYCNSNYITSFEGIADQIKRIDGSFVCDDNDKIKSHVLGLMLIEGLREIDCTDEWAKILNKCIKNGLGIYDAQTMLMEANLEEYAQL